MEDNILHNNNELDSFLKEKYKNHVTPPDPELWEGIKMCLYQNNMNRNMRQVQSLKIASISLGVALVATLAYFEFKINNLKKQEQKNKPVLSLGEQTNSNQKITPIELKITSNQGENKILKKNSNYNNLQGIGNSHTQKINLKNNIIEVGQPENEGLLILPDSVDKRERKSLFSENINNIENQDTEKLITILLTENPDTEVANNHTFKPLAQINVGSKGQLPNNQEIDNLKSDISENVQEKHEQNRYFVEGFFSPEISYRILSLNPDIEQPIYNKAYFGTRDKANFTFSAGIKAGYLINGKWAVKTGIFFSQYAQRFKTEAVHVLYNNENGYIYTSTGLAKLSITSSDTIAPETFFNSSLRFNYLNFPLMVDYKISHNYTISCGLNFSYILWQGLNWQAENYDGDSESNYDEIEGIKTRSISMLIGVSYERPITQNIKLVINPSLITHLTSISKTSPVKAFPYSWGLQTGFRYYF